MGREYSLEEIVRGRSPDRISDSTPLAELRHALSNVGYQRDYVE